MATTLVSDIMNNNLVIMDVSKSIKNAADLMNEKGIGCVIVTKENFPVGILTERDFVKRIAAKEKNPSTLLSEVMSSPLIVARPEQTVWEAAQIMKTKKIHKIPIQRDDKVVGIITTSDLIEVCSVGSDSEMRRICDQIVTRLQNE